MTVVLIALKSPSPVHQKPWQTVTSFKVLRENPLPVGRESAAMDRMIGRFGVPFIGL